MSDQLREMGNKDYEKAGRHSSDLFTKVPPKGYRAVLGWMGNIPVGDYVVKFNNLIDCLIKDPHYINIAHNFDEQLWNGIKKIWERLMVELLKLGILCQNSSSFVTSHIPDSPDECVTRLVKAPPVLNGLLRSATLLSYREAHQISFPSD
ncbi:uncharacterized protein A4U43_C06F19010 [Asparagus officinalis]|uniref:Uncharacterized protein n=1 Tax=Asparagus officinalis TaxID=4686 RepID=A0A5P1EMU8_ASPOF|nr:uncharacterized protein A4U43_C06F19010 [Asparagus officinalis]